MIVKGIFAAGLVFGGLFSIQTSAAPAFASFATVTASSTAPIFVQAFGPGNQAGPGQGPGPARFQSRYPLEMLGSGDDSDSYGKRRPRCRRGLFGRITNADKCLPKRKRRRAEPEEGS